MRQNTIFDDKSNLGKKRENVYKLVGNEMLG